MNKIHIFQVVIGRHVFACFVSLLALASSFICSNAYATSSIMTANGATSCSSCHTGGLFTQAEGQAGLAAFLAARTPVCTAPQVLNAARTACVTPPPSCTAPQVLNAARTACVTPSPALTCVAPQIPNATNTACVAPAPTTCGALDQDDEDEGMDDDDGIQYSKPVLSAPNRVTVHSGESLSLVVTAFDCADRPIDIQATGLPSGATITNSFDAQLQMPKATITWGAPENLAGQRMIKITFRAVATEIDGRRVSSSPLRVNIIVLPASQSRFESNDQLVRDLSIASARVTERSRRIEVTGQVVWGRASSVTERNNLIAREKVVLTNAATGAQLGEVAVNRNGRWKKVIAVNPASAPCSIDASFHGKMSVKAVSGARNCAN